MNRYAPLYVIALLLTLGGAVSLAAQQVPELELDPAEEPDVLELLEQREDDDPPELPSSFSGVTLGMDVETVKERLLEAPDFSYRGDPDVTLTPDREQQLIEVEGIDFVDRAFFQFEDKELYIMIVHLNREQLDYFTMYTNLSSKYGEPAVFHPSHVVWESDDLRLSLERPLTVKYISRPVFERLVENGRMERSRRDLSREQFLEQF
ncbi:MAG: hypothetical protein ACQETQ_09730 [Spirochaetota bacterium]